MGGENPSGLSLQKQFGEIKRKEFPWTYEVAKSASGQPFRDLDKAFRRFFKKKGKYPRFKKKGIRDSFYIQNNSVRTQHNKLWVPKLGWVNLYTPLRFEGKILSATISRTANRWFVSISMELDPKSLPAVCENQESVGVDLGLNHLAVLSNEEVFDSPKALRKHEKKLKRLQRRLSKTKKGSQNRRKARIRLSKLHYRIKCIRDDFTHKLTTYLVRNFSRIVIEDLHVKGMIKNHSLAKSIVDASWGELRRQLEYKAKLYNRELIIANRWFPSSKKCWWCGEKRTDLTLGDRTFICEHCGWKVDRDLNAAMNFAEYTTDGQSEF